ncbi:MAG: hypothetical protein DYG85_05895 [Chloroflexi bacterium CFX1]|nr:hypothetical protein [Chloroflexi bacterium CFX1]MCQ3953002.1 hypothetical protein [Chloroflexota bacterium]MDL1919514.1 hypothetical protein [Chloroflexi bacterium CFX5]NUQ58631.1 hypothetical protein [Anaerolineales bacterium]
MNLKPILILPIVFALVSCNLGAPAPQDQTEAATAAALTVQAALSPAASPTAEAQAAQTATPVPDGATAEPQPCEEKAEIAAWTRDGVAYDKAEADKPLKPGAGFVMSWEFKNTGDCTWNDGYKMVFDSGERLTQADTFGVMPGGHTVKPGETLTVTIQMTAPSAPGTYQSAFKLIDPNGKRVIIPGVATKVGAPSSGSLPAPGDLRYEYSCSPGVVNIKLTWKDKSDNEEGFRVYRDGTKIADLPPGSTTYDDVLSAPGSYAYAVAAFNSGGESPANVVATTTNCQ